MGSWRGFLQKAQGTCSSIGLMSQFGALCISDLQSESLALRAMVVSIIIYTQIKIMIALYKRFLVNELYQ